MELLESLSRYNNLSGTTNQGRIDQMTAAINQQAAALQGAYKTFRNIAYTDLAIPEGVTAESILENLKKFREKIPGLVNIRVSLGGPGMSAELTELMYMTQPSLKHTIGIQMAVARKKSQAAAESAATDPYTESIWTEESPPPEPEVFLQDPEPEPGLLAGIFPGIEKNILLIAGGVIFVGILIFKKK